MYSFKRRFLFRLILWIMFVHSAIVLYIVYNIFEILPLPSLYSLNAVVKVLHITKIVFVRRCQTLYTHRKIWNILSIIIFLLPCDRIKWNGTSFGVMPSWICSYTSVKISPFGKTFASFLLDRSLHGYNGNFIIIPSTK